VRSDEPGSASDHEQRHDRNLAVGVRDRNRGPNYSPGQAA
jgi:hypothetical protein